MPGYEDFIDPCDDNNILATEQIVCDDEQLHDQQVQVVLTEGLKPCNQQFITNYIYLQKI